MNKQNGFSAAEGLLIIIVIVIVLFGGWYVWSKNRDDTNQSTTTSQQVQQSQNISPETQSSPENEQIYNSKLYPALSFTYPDGWAITEPDKYDETNFSAGWADGSITISKNSSTLTFNLSTVLATGFEGYTCTKEDDLQPVGDYYRFKDSDGLIQYRSGITKKDDVWQTVINDPDFTNIVDDDPNYCVSFPFIGTYDTNIKQSDYPDLPYGFNDNETAVVWLSAEFSGTDSNKEILLEVDKIITSLSESIEIF